jgi:hypothetical protein
MLRKLIGTAACAVVALILLSSANLLAQSHAAPKSVAHAQPNGIPQDGLIADLGFTEQSGTVAYDATGNGNDCTFGTGTNAPYWNGIGLGMDSANGGKSLNEYCSLPSTLPTQTRSVAVCAYLPAQVEMATLNDGSKGTGGAISYATLLGAENRPGLTVMLQTPSFGTSRIYYQQSTYFNYGGFGSGTNDMSIGWNCFFYVFGSSADKPATVDHLYKNGVEVSSYQTQKQSGSYLPLTGAWYLGGWGFADYLQFVGTFEHVLAWDRMLSADEVASSWSALQAEMIGRGVVFAPPTSQTTDSVADCLGDSQTSGHVGKVKSWCNPINITLPPADSWLLKNNGEQGTTCVAMESGVPAEEALDWSPFAPHSTLMLYCGINDLVVSGQSPADVWQRQLATCQEAKQAGYETVLDVTLPSWVGYDTDVEAVNALVRSNWRSCFSSVIDDAIDPNLGAAGAYSNATYFQQTEPSHLTNTGQTLLGQYATNNLASVYGNTAANPTSVSGAAYTMLAADNVVQTTAAATAVTLPDCLGYTPGHQREIWNSASGAVTVIAQNTEGINGGQTPITVPAGAQEFFGVQLVSPTAAGCTWHDATTHVTLVPATNPIVSGMTENFTVSIGTADGTVATTGSVGLRCGQMVYAPVSVSNGSAAFAVSSAGYKADNYLCTASFSDPTANYAASSAGVSVQLLNQASQIVLTSPSNAYTVGDTATFTATVTGQNYTPTSGTVALTVDGNQLGTGTLNSSGVATISLTANYPPGIYTMTAAYYGADGTAGSTTTGIYVLNPDLSDAR